jgi:membrane-associated phospholipid phosphatase
MLYSRRLLLALNSIVTSGSVTSGSVELPGAFDAFDAFNPFNPFNPFPRMGCTEEFLWDVFGSSAVCVLVESILKAVFRRSRPGYTAVSASNNFTMESPTVPYEEYSFPSGHSLRAFYLAVWMSHSPFVGRGDFSLHVQSPVMAMPWAAAVAWSRVAKGRHYPVDVLVGASVGVALGYLVEVYFDAVQRGISKCLGGFFITFFFGTRLIIPALRQGGPAKSTSKVTFCYFAFYVGLFVATLPREGEWGLFGRQTLVEKDGVLVCGRTWWGGEF